MKVECIQNKLKNIEESIYNDIFGFDSDSILPIEVGQQSIVYAIATINKNLWYLVDVYGLRYPMFYPRQCFKIIDSKLSKYWKIKETLDFYNNDTVGVIIGFEEFINNDLFYSELLEDNENIIEIFNNYKVKMLKE